VGGRVYLVNTKVVSTFFSFNGTTASLQSILLRFKPTLLLFQLQIMLLISQVKALLFHVKLLLFQFSLLSFQLSCSSSSWAAPSWVTLLRFQWHWSSSVTLLLFQLRCSSSSYGTSPCLQFLLIAFHLRCFSSDYVSYLPVMLLLFQFTLFSSLCWYSSAHTVCFEPSFLRVSQGQVLPFLFF
jgi:hypothetical protein